MGIGHYRRGDGSAQRVHRLALRGSWVRTSDLDYAIGRRARRGDHSQVRFHLRCRPPAGGWRIIAAHDGDDPAVSATTTERFDGDFRIALTLPSDFPEGEAYAGVENWDYSSCNGTNSSCAAAAGDFTVNR